MKIIDNDYERCRQWMKDQKASSYCEEICIGLESNGELIAAIGYGWYNTKSMHMHLAKKQGTNVSREFLWFAFYYPFYVCGTDLLICITVQDNKADRVAKHAGFNLHGVIPNGAPDGNLNIWVLRKENAKLLNYKIRSSKDGWK